MDPNEAKLIKQMDESLGRINEALAAAAAAQNAITAFDATFISRSVSINLGLVAANSSAQSTVSLAGALAGYPVNVAPPAGAITTGLAFSAHAIAANEASLRCINATIAAVTVGAATYGFLQIQQ